MGSHRRNLDPSGRNETSSPNSGEVLQDPTQGHVGVESPPSAEFIEAYIAKGLSQQESGDWSTALDHFQEAARLDPTRAPVYLLIGNAFGRLGRWAEAVESYQHAIRVDPLYPDAHNNLGIALLEIGRNTDAIAAYARAIEINPGHANAYFNLGKVLAGQNKFDIATELFEKTIAIQPLHAYAYLELGGIQEKSGHLKRAAASYRRSVELDPSRTARGNLAAVLTLLGDPIGIEQLRHLVLEQPLDAEAHWNLGMGLLRHGKAEEGWREFEWRMEIPRFRRQHHRFDQPRWGGEPLEGRTILLYGEQGHGDTLQFLRYLPLVVERGGRVILEVPPLLCSLLQRFPGVTECVALGAAKREFSTVASLMSLPHLLRAESIPAPYDPTGQVTAEAHPRQSGRLKVGLAWAGNQKHQQDRLRSIPLSQWESLAQTEGVEFTSLQMGPDSLGVINPENRFNFAENCADLQDFAELAAVVAKQDLVIAVDTAVAHLAGTWGSQSGYCCPMPPTGGGVCTEAQPIGIQAQSSSARPRPATGAK